jgi:SAM-dependent methyltransferase
MPNGDSTFPERPILASTGEAKATLRSLHLAFGGDYQGKTIVDLGCLEGGFTLLFAQAGMEALGIEAREMNIEKCEYVAKAFELPNLRFALDDVRNIQSHGRFDAVFCSGLLYHLDDPTAYLRTLSRVTKRVLIIDTHYSRAPDRWLDRLAHRVGIVSSHTGPPHPMQRVGRKLLHRWIDPVQTRYNLSELLTHEGNLGRWLPEFSESATRDEIEKAAWSSWGNRRSFWLEKRCLLEALMGVGFAPVFEQFDYLDNVVTDRHYEDVDRGMFVAYKSG